MPSTPSPGLRLELMQQGEDENSWGDKTNTNLILLEDVVTKRTTVLPTNANITLTALNYADDQSRALSIQCGPSTLTADVSIIIPNVARLYVIDNQTTGNHADGTEFKITIQTAVGATTVSCPQGQVSLIYCDGLDHCRGAQAPGHFALIDTQQSFTAGQAVTSHALTYSASITVDAALGNNFSVTLTGNSTFGITNILDGEPLTIAITQDATAGWVPTFASNVLWPNNITPTWSTIPNATDLVRLIYFAAANVYYGEVIYDFGTVGGTAQFNFHITDNTLNWVLAPKLGALGAAAVINVTLDQGVIAYSTDPSIAALDLSGAPSGSTVNLYLSKDSYVLGAGGNGANGTAQFGFGAGIIHIGSNPGADGGPAIKGPGTGNTFNVHNTPGFIWGGGGGGGAGGSTCAVGNNSGGGGGGGGTNGGKGGSEWYSASPGSLGHGSNAVVGIGSTAGTGSAGFGTDFGAGGAGGDWGTAGVNGSDSTGGGTATFPHTAGGAGGKAINLNGGTASLDSTGSPFVKGAVA